MLIVPLTILTLSLQSALASNHAWCGTKENLWTTSKSVSMNYQMKVTQQNLETGNKKKSVSTGKEVKMNRLKVMLNKASSSDLEKIKVTLEKLASRVPTNNPNYYMIDLLSSYVNELLSKNMGSASIVDVVVKTADVSILKDIVVSLGLVETLNGKWPFTVFAPTNKAFENLLAELWMTFDELAANKELLKSVVLYHVIWSKVSASEVVKLTEWTLVETVWGESVRISNWDWVKVDTSNVTTTDIMTSNWVIHLIDEVLLPPSVRQTLWLPGDRGTENIVTTAVNNGSFSTLVAAVQAAGLVDVLSGEWPFTVFAPTEEAFAKLLSDLHLTASELLANKELLTKVLTYHVVPGFYTADDVLSLKNAKNFSTAQWSSVSINPNWWSPKINESNIITTDVFASNGVIHVIDKVLIPSS